MQTNEPEPDNESEVPCDPERPNPGDGGPQFRVHYVRTGLSPEEKESLIPLAIASGPPGS
jgi:hypothetical protein